MKIEMLQEQNIAFIRRTGPYGPGNAQTMDAIKAWASLQGLMNEDAVFMGMALDNPFIIEADACRYDSCVIVDWDFGHDDKVMFRSFFGGKYAVFELEHTEEAMTRAWSYVFQLIGKAGLQMDESRPIVERYATNLVRMHKCELCVPVL